MWNLCRNFFSQVSITIEENDYRLFIWTPEDCELTASKSLLNPVDFVCGFWQTAYLYLNCIWQSGNQETDAVLVNDYATFVADSAQAHAVEIQGNKVIGKQIVIAPVIIRPIVLPSVSIDIIVWVSEATVSYIYGHVVTHVEFEGD